MINTYLYLNRNKVFYFYNIARDWVGVGFQAKPAPTQRWGGVGFEKATHLVGWVWGG